MKNNSLNLNPTGKPLTKGDNTLSIFERLKYAYQRSKYGYSADDILAGGEFFINFLKDYLNDYITKMPNYFVCSIEDQTLVKSLVNCLEDYQRYYKEEYNSWSDVLLESWADNFLKIEPVDLNEELYFRNKYRKGGLLKGRLTKYSLREEAIKENNLSKEQVEILKAFIEEENRNSQFVFNLKKQIKKNLGKILLEVI